MKSKCITHNNHFKRLDWSKKSLSHNNTFRLKECIQELTNYTTAIHISTSSSNGN